MEELVNILKVLVADTVALKYKAHGYHWNVEGSDFKPWHSFFSDIYEDMESAVDEYAEWIRMVDSRSFAPFKLSRFVELTTIPESDVSTNPLVMASDLVASIEMINNKVVYAFDIATAAKQQGLANFFADRQAAHQKFIWMLKASLENV